MNKYFAYLRVSTAKQGEHGVSLQEQRDSILRFAERSGLEITGWFEERETAAKRGRPIFAQMLKGLKQGKAQGVLIHKIDRSARNLKDWADLGELIDQGIQVHFANENLDMRSRGGRLSADIQAVVAADYIRNLREETRKGFYGRLKQGLYPLPAPLGYLDVGKGQLKDIDPLKGPLVKNVFELYASGRYTLDLLVQKADEIGLRNRANGRISRNGIARLLKNEFYVGLIRIDRTGEIFQGRHEPLIHRSLFEDVKLVLSGKIHPRCRRHKFLFSRLLTCQPCTYSLAGETQKGHNYYRCHTPSCPTTGIREEKVDQTLKLKLHPLELTPTELNAAEKALTRFETNWTANQEQLKTSLNLRLAQIQDRLSRLTDAFVDGLLDQATFGLRKSTLLAEKAEMELKLQENMSGRKAAGELAEIFELAKRAYSIYELGDLDQKRELIQNVTSNRSVDRKNVILTLKPRFAMLADRPKYSDGSPTGNRTPI